MATTNALRLAQALNEIRDQQGMGENMAMNALSEPLSIDDIRVHHDAILDEETHRLEYLAWCDYRNPSSEFSMDLKNSEIFPSHYLAGNYMFSTGNIEYMRKYDGLQCGAYIDHFGKKKIVFTYDPLSAIKFAIVYTIPYSHNEHLYDCMYTGEEEHQGLSATARRLFGDDDDDDE